MRSTRLSDRNSRSRSSVGHGPGLTIRRPIWIRRHFWARDGTNLVVELVDEKASFGKLPYRVPTMRATRELAHTHLAKIPLPTYQTPLYNNRKTKNYALDILNENYEYSSHT